MPVTVFIARDHHHVDQRFQNVKESDKIAARVIGVRYELNDICICAIATLVHDIKADNHRHNEKKPKIRVLGGDDSDDGDHDV